MRSVSGAGVWHVSIGDPPGMNVCSELSLLEYPVDSASAVSGRRMSALKYFIVSESLSAFDDDFIDQPGHVYIDREIDLDGDV